MKKTREQKGITLIALIITIVVLLILAVVAINSIQNDGILSHAGNVANTYNQAVKNEQETLQNYLDYLDKNNGSTTYTWTQSGTTVTNGTVTLEVGTTVTGYTSPTGTTDPGWAVLGAENGQLLIVSATTIKTSYSLNGEIHLKDADNNGKIDGIDYLDSLCANYLNSALASNARSITVEDITKIAGGGIEEEKVTFTEAGVNSGPGVFKHPDGRIMGENGVTSIDVMNMSISCDSSNLSQAIKSLLFTYDNDTSDGAYVLATVVSYTNFPYEASWDFVSMQGILTPRACNGVVLWIAEILPLVVCMPTGFVQSLLLNLN